MKDTQAMPDAGEHVMLAGLTTLGLGGPAGRFVHAGTDEEVIAAVAAADQRGEPVLVLGGGSNVVVADEGFPGTVIHVATRGIHREPAGGVPREPARGVPREPAGGGPREPAGGVHQAPVAGPAPSAATATPTPGVGVTVAAGEEWDGVVASCTEWELAGLECLSGIPGLAGATPIQNVGAYGQEVAESITAVRAYDRESGKVVILSPEDCGFGYRTSALKLSMTIWEGPHIDADRGRASRRPQAAGFTGRFVVLAVSFLLMPDRLSWPVRYSELAKALDVGEGGRAPLADVRAAVLSLRRGKGMVVDPADPDSRSAGSFFTNPVLSVAQFEALEEAVAGRCGPGTPIPRFPAGPGAVKVPAAWLISQAGFQKGYQPGASPGENAARISTKHSLALVNPGGATASGVVGLAREIRNRVRDMFGVDLSVEPILVGLSL